MVTEALSKVRGAVFRGHVAREFIGQRTSFRARALTGVDVDALAITAAFHARDLQLWALGCRSLAHDLARIAVAGRRVVCTSIRHAHRQRRTRRAHTCHFHELAVLADFAIGIATRRAAVSCGARTPTTRARTGPTAIGVGVGCSGTALVAATTTALARARRLAARIRAPTIRIVGTGGTKHHQRKNAANRPAHRPSIAATDALIDATPAGTAAGAD